MTSAVCGCAVLVGLVCRNGRTYRCGRCHRSDGIKARTGEVTTAYAAILEILKGETGGTAFDAKLTGPRIADKCVNRVADMAALMTPLIETLTLKRERMAQCAGDGFTTAVALVDTMVEHGLSFRTAHHVVGRLVRMAAERGFTHRDVTSALLDEAAREIIGKDLELSNRDIRNALDPVGFVRARGGLGGPAEREVRRMMAARRKENARWQRNVNDRASVVARAEAALSQAARRVA